MVYVMDALMVIIFLGAVHIGAARSWKVSFSSGMAHILSMVAAWLIASFGASSAANFVFSHLQLSELLPSSIGFWVAPVEESIVYTLIFSLLFISGFITSKSIFHAFSWTYEWGEAMFKKVRFPRIIDGIFSIFFTVFHAATWIWGILLVVAFPFFNLDKNHSLTGLIVGNPLMQSQIATLYKPYEALHSAVAIIGDEMFQVWEEGQLNSAFFANLEPNRRMELKDNLREALAYLPPEFDEAIHLVISEMEE